MDQFMCASRRTVEAMFSIEHVLAKSVLGSTKVCECLPCYNLKNAEYTATGYSYEPSLWSAETGNLFFLPRCAPEKLFFWRDTFACPVPHHPARSPHPDCLVQYFKLLPPSDKLKKRSSYY